MKKHLSLLCIILAVLALVAGCKKDENPVNPGGGGTTSTTYTGVFSNPAETGRLTFEIPTAKVLAGDTVLISGKIFLATGDTVLLSGFYVKTTGQIHVAGGGYVFDGTYAAGQITGSYTGPNGSGGFTVREATGENTIKVYCGHYQQNSPGTNSGSFTMIVDGTSVTIMVDGDDPLYGTVDGSTVNIYFPGTTVVLATGTISTEGASGQYNTGDEQGTWSATPCQ
jgi:hypothetical protein